jgi:hypothetical protein
MQNLQASAVPDTMVDLPMNMTPLASPVFNATGQVIGHQSALGFSPAAGFGFHGWVDTNDIFGLGKGVSLDTPWARCQHRQRYCRRSPRAAR